MKRIVVLGSTGSIGVNTLKVVQNHPKEFEVVGLAARNNVELLAAQFRTFQPKAVAIQDPSRHGELKRCVNGAQLFVGEEGISALAAMEGVDLVVVAITGAAALKPTLAAIEKGRTIGLANKETLVMAGELVMERAKRHRATILPIDSEHSAIFQCLPASWGLPGQAGLQGHSVAEIRRILLTTSGGPLKDVPVAQFSSIPKARVMEHPRWKMGPKITVDSATMMNKALEVIEARSLFGVPVEKIEVVVHPQAVVHSLVEFIDGSILAQLGVTDMRIPIQYALTHPRRLPSSLPSLDLVELKELTFEAPNPEKFPCLRLGRQAAKAGGTLPAVLNAANEACVEAFLNDALAFVQIPERIESVMGQHQAVSHPTLDQILEADAWARERAAESPGKRASPLTKV